MARQPKPVSPSLTGNGLSIRQLVRSTPALMKNNAQSVVLKSYNPLAQSKSGLPAVTSVCVDHVSATQPPRPHKCWFVGLSRNTESLSNQKKVLFQCDCESYMFTFEYANSINGAARIMFSNGEPASMTNPTNRPGLCIAEGMMVTTEHGLVPIEKLKVGDRVHTLEGLSSVLVAKQTGTGREIVRLETSLFSDPLYCTPDHKILIYKNNATLDWIEAKNLNVGDTVLSCSRTKKFEEAGWDDFLFNRIVSLTTAGYSNVYCPEVEAGHFIANNILVLNCKHGVRLAEEILQNND